MLAAGHQEVAVLTLGRAPRYCAWVLRCWEVPGEAPGAPGSWRCSLEDPGTRERRGFASLEALTAFLRAELAAGCDPPPEESVAAARGQPAGAPGTAAPGE